MDTSALTAIGDLDDENHKAAVEFREKIRRGDTLFRKLYTSNYVVDETLTLLRSHSGHKAAVAFRHALESSTALEVLWVDQDVEHTAWNIFEKHPDKDFSFTDCTSFALMQTEAIRNAFTFDRHFNQYGFEVVP